MLTATAIKNALAQDRKTLTGRVPQWDDGLMDAVFRAVYSREMTVGPSRPLSDVLDSRAARLLAGTQVIVHRMDELPDWSASGGTLLIHGRALEALLPKPRLDEAAILSEYRDNVLPRITEALEDHYAFVASTTDRPMGSRLPRLSADRLRAAIIRQLDAAGRPGELEFMLDLIGLDDTATIAQTRIRLDALLVMDSKHLHEKGDASTIALIALAKKMDEDLTAPARHFPIPTSLMSDHELLEDVMGFSPAQGNRISMLNACLGLADTQKTKTFGWSDFTVHDHNRKTVAFKDDCLARLINFTARARVPSKVVASEELVANIHGTFKVRDAVIRPIAEKEPQAWRTGRTGIENALVFVVLAAQLPTNQPAVMVESASVSHLVPVTENLIQQAETVLPEFLSVTNPNILRHLQSLHAQPLWTHVVLSDKFRSIAGQACCLAEQSVNESLNRHNLKRLESDAAGLRALFDSLHAPHSCFLAGSPDDIASALSDTPLNVIASYQKSVQTAGRVLSAYEKFITGNPLLVNTVTEKQTPLFLAFKIIRLTVALGWPPPVEALDVCRQNPEESWNYLENNFYGRYTTPNETYSGPATEIVRLTASPDLVEAVLSGKRASTLNSAALSQCQTNALKDLAAALPVDQIEWLTAKHPTLRGATGFKEVFERSTLLSGVSVARKRKPSRL